jgi:hypothetical protein
MLSWTARLEQAKAELAQSETDPLRGKVAATMRGMDAVSTAALLDLIGLPKTTGNGRRIAHSMRSLGFVPIKSRRFMPGGYRDTVTRGWARPVREPGVKQGDKVGILHPKTDQTDELKEACHVL